MARVALPKSKIRARRKKRRTRLAAVCAGVFVVLFLLLALVSHASFMRINSVSVMGAQTILPNDVQKDVLQSLTGSYFFLFPKDNIFLYPKSAAEANLLAAMPTISTVRIQAKNFHTLQVSVTERTRKALWCPQDDLTLPSNIMPLDCALLDQDGVVYASAASATSTMRYFGPLQGSGYPQQYIPPDRFHSLSALADALTSLSQSQTATSTPDTPVAVEVLSDGVHVHYQSGFVLIFSPADPSGDVYSHFLLAQKSDVFAGKTLADFEYLDLRFGDKLYYKLHDNPTPVKSK